MEQHRDIDTLTNLPIPLEAGNYEGWKEIPIYETEHEEPLVALGPFSDHSRILTSSVYAGEHSNSPYESGELKGSLLTIFARESVANRLDKAQNLLPPNLRLIVFDAYRTLEVQQALYDQYYNPLAAQKPDWTPEELSKETQKYVSLPSSPDIDPDAKFVSPHNTGGAIDVAIVELPIDVAQRINNIEAEITRLDSVNSGGKTENWREIYRLEMEKIALVNTSAKMLDFGTDFDHGGEKSALTYFERIAKERPLTHEEQTALKNRRLLFNVMSEARFQPFADEWWHFNAPETQMGARVAGLSQSTFGSAHLSEKNIALEDMRRGHRDGTVKLANGLPTVNLPQSETLVAVVDGVNITGDIRQGADHPIERIEPSKITG